MLSRSLSERAAGCFYGDNRLADRLWKALLDAPYGLAADSWQTLQDDFYNILADSIDIKHPRNYRLTDIRQLVGQLCGGQLLTAPELPWLDELSDQLLLRNGDLIHYREDKVQAYVRLAAEIDPTLLVAWKLSGWLRQSPQPKEQDIRRVVTAQAPFFAPPGNPMQPVAEGHIHFRGITADSMILNDHLFKRKKVASNKKVTDMLEKARAILALMFSDGIIPFKKHHKKSKRKTASSNRAQLQVDQTYTQLSWPDRVKSLHDPMLDRLYLPDWQNLSKMHHSAPSPSSDWILTELAHTMTKGGPNSWLWLHLYLCNRYRSDDAHPLERTAILCFWQALNVLRATLIMDGQGLTRFAEHYFSCELGRSTDHSYSDNMQRLFPGSRDVAEVKSGPLSFTPNFAKRFDSLSNQYYLTPPYIFGEHETAFNVQTTSYLQSFERWHYCGHFNRSVKYQRGKRGKADSRKLWGEAGELMRNLRSQSGWSRPEFLGGKLNQHFHFQPSNWFRGLDVAGDENSLKIEWFAPILRWLRGAHFDMPENTRASKGFHFSIHAGEDYAHPASGMRHIDETVRFCEMRDGDRLGHALALGIEPSRWIDKQGEMLLPVDEHLDNLVWLWHYATQLSARLSLAHQVLPLLERRIARFYRECDWWWTPSHIEDSAGFSHQDAKSSSCRHFRSDSDDDTPEQLFRAWLLRRNCYYRWQELHDSPSMTQQDTAALPDLIAINDQDSHASRLYLARHQQLANDNEPKLVIVRTGKEWLSQLPQGATNNSSSASSMPLEDIETPEELEFMYALQDYLLDQYDKMGLMIETNPTSNVYIARINEHSEHPIFRWYPPDESALESGGEANRFGLRRGPIRVLVNTDDPGIMPTTLRTEFLLLREAAISRGISRTTAENWLETIRGFGLEQFHRNHQPVFTPV